MATYTQTNDNSCGPSCLIVADNEKNNTAMTQEIVIYNRIQHLNNRFGGLYCMPHELANEATQMGFNVEIVLSGIMFPRILKMQYPRAVTAAKNAGITVNEWRGWSPRYWISRNQWVLMVVICVDACPLWTGRGVWGAGGGIGGYLASGLGYLRTAAGGVAGALGGLALTSAWELLNGVGVIGNENFSLHYVLYRNGKFMDPATGRDYWLFSSMGGRRSYYDTGIYIYLT